MDWTNIGVSVVITAIFLAIAVFLNYLITKSTIENNKTSINSQEMIADRNIKIEVRSKNRQAWINDLRKTSAEYLSEIENFNNMISLTNTFIPHSQTGNFDAQKEVANKVNDTRVAIKKINMLQLNITFLLNPTEKLSQKINQAMHTMRNNLDSYNGKGAPQKVEQAKTAFIKYIQKVLKKEWERVKAGE